MNGTKRRHSGTANTTTTTTRKTRLIVAKVKAVEEESETEAETAVPKPKTTTTKKTVKQQPVTDATKAEDDPLSDLHHLAADKSDVGDLILV
ncbi:hypothetical protein PG984_016224 [Apiospora sp. TS-2023a]